MLARGARAPWTRLRPWLPALAVGSTVVLLAATPAPLLPIARGYAALCERYPTLALVTNHAPPLPLALLLGLAALSLLAGGRAGAVGLLATLRFDRRLRRCAGPVPPRLARLGGALAIATRLTSLAAPEPMACCYGFLRPRVAVTAGLFERLDDAELAAVLGHERQHLRRCDPLRYLLLDALTAAAFMFPAAPALRRRCEARIELAADRAALAIAPRGALAGALLAVLASPRAAAPGVAGLSATEARIAQLAGRPALPPIPARAVAASLGVAAVVVLATVDLAASADLVRMVCPLCPWIP